MASNRVDDIVSQLIEQKLLIGNILLERETESFVCDAENLERLLRSIRKKSRMQFTALPACLPSVHLVYRGTRLIVIAHKTGKELECNFAMSDPEAVDCCKYLFCCATAKTGPLRSQKIEMINGVSVIDSELSECFEWAGFVREYRYLRVF